MRTLHINQTEYRYKIGNRFVKIVSPKRACSVELTKITGKSDKWNDADWGDYVEDRYGNLINFNLIITPQMIKDYIIKHNL